MWQLNPPHSGTWDSVSSQSIQPELRNLHEIDADIWITNLVGGAKFTLFGPSVMDLEELEVFQRAEEVVRELIARHENT